MKFLHFYRVPLPDPRADAVQIVNTAAGLARAGADVALHVERLIGPVKDCLAFYGVDPPAEGGRIDLVPLGGHWSWPIFPWKTGGILKRAAGGRGGGPAVLYVREVRPYVPGLMERARARGLKVIFEAHNVSALLVKEKEQKAAGPGPDRVFSMAAPPGESLENAPPNLDTTPAPPPPPESAPTAEARALRKKAEQRAALEQRILKLAHGLVCTQKATLEGLHHLLPAGVPATVLGNGTQLPPAREGVAKDIDVLYCGSLKPWKGVDTLVAAMQTLHPHTLTIVGPGTKQDIQRLQQAALAVGALTRTKILPPVKPSEVWDLYARAKVGVIPLPDQGFVEARDFTSPLKLFEMMAAGLPIVASRLRSLQEYVADGREAVLVTADDPRPLAEALRKVLADEQLRTGLATAARARAAEFSWDQRGQKLVAFAQEVGG